MSLCENCADKTCYSYSHSISECEDFIPQTNADRIRSMSDEELSEFLLWLKTECYLCPAEKNCDRSSCHEAFLFWIKSPVEVDNGT